MGYELRLAPVVADLVDKMSERARVVVAENLTAILADPQHAGNPSFNRKALLHARQHVCPHSYLVLYRWQGCDPDHEPGVITVDNLVERL